MREFENLGIREFGNLSRMLSGLGMWEWNTDMAEKTNVADLIHGCGDLGMWGCENERI
jgi:hypothetical protein